jgi:RNA polymerase sigma factor (sigma-70 family)
MEMPVKSRDQVLEATCARHWKPLVNFGVTRFCLEREEAEQIAQEAFVSLFTSFGQLRNANDHVINGFLYRCATNRALTLHRRRAIERDVLTKADWIKPELGSDSTEANIFREERDVQLREIIECLPAGYRVLVSAHYISNISYEELAETNQCTVSAIRQRLARAFKMLRRMPSAQKLARTYAI